MPGRASTRTSVWSDNPTEVAAYSNDGTVKEGRLIDYDPPSEPELEEMAPGDKLRELLRAMQQEVDTVKPVTTTTRDRWRGATHSDREDRHPEGSSSRDSSPERAYTGEGESEEEESPPTPPPRLTNPYAGRRIERRSPDTSQPARLPSRAAVLLNSISKSPPPRLSEESHKSPPSRLEAFLAHSTISPPASYADPVAESSTSRSRISLGRATQRESFGIESFRDIRSAALGNDNDDDATAQEEPSTATASLRNKRLRGQTPQPDISAGRSQATPASRHAALRTRQPPPPTPRRSSVDLAPTDMDSFARDLGGLEIRAEVELDLDEGFSKLGWDDSESVGDVVLAEEGERADDAGEGYSRERETSSRREYERSAPPVSLEQRSSRTQMQLTRDPSTPFRDTSRAGRPSPPPSATSSPLPALPEPDESNASESSEADTYSSRRAALFRSVSRSDSAPASALASRSAAHSSVSRPSTPHSRSKSAARDSLLAQANAQTPSPSFRTDVGSRSRLSHTSWRSLPDSGSGVNSQVEEAEAQVQEDRESVLPPRASNMESSPARREMTDSLGESSRRGLSISESRSLRKSEPHSRSSHLFSRDQISNASTQQHNVPSEPSTAGVPSPPARIGITTAPSPSPRPAEFTPPRPSAANLSIGPTPKPPGAWQSTSRGKVRFTPSPLGKGSPLRGDITSSSSRSSAVAGEDSVSIYRIRLSPRRGIKAGVSDEAENRASPGKGGVAAVDNAGDSSLIGRMKETLSGSLSKQRERIVIPRPSTTLHQASISIQSARDTSVNAQKHLESAQRQWLDALSSFSPVSVHAGLGQVMRKSWYWSTWAWWIMVELIVLWGVFRVTLDYATSVTRLSSLDPFHPLALPLDSSASAKLWGLGPFGASNPISLTIPIPGALQSLVGRQSSANVFDMLEGWDLWRRFVLLSHGSEEGAYLTGRLLGAAGVPS
ncbi:hypothetical protein IAU60_003776 [Kwoniella sp. DSM 27419]